MRKLLLFIMAVVFVGCSNPDNSKVEEKEPITSEDVKTEVTISPTSAEVLPTITETEADKEKEDVSSEPAIENETVVINLNDYVKVTFSGYNEGGYASVKFDKEQFMLDNIENVAFNKKNQRVYQEVYGGDFGDLAVSELKRFISVRARSTEGKKYLSDGDTVELVWDVRAEGFDTKEDIEKSLEKWNSGDRRKLLFLTFLD